MATQSALRPWTLIAAVVAAIGVHMALWDASYAVFTRSIDFNHGALEDFMGPYLTTGREVLETGRPAPGFLYTPFFAIVLSAFATVDPALASWIWLSLELASTALLVALGLVLVRGGPAWLAPVYVFCALTSFPLAHNLHWGQVSVLLGVLVLGAVWAIVARARALGGGLLALAAGVKLYPALFVLVPLSREDWRTVTSFAVASAVVLFGVPMAVLGGAQTLEFYRAVLGALDVAQSGDGAWLDAPAQQFLPAVVGRWTGLDGGVGRVALQVASWGWAVANLVLVRRFALAGSRYETLLAFAVVALSLPLVVSPSWPHYFVLLPFAQLLLVRCAPRDGVVLALVAASVVVSSAVFFRIVADPGAYGRAGWLLLADLALLGAVFRLLTSPRGSVLHHDDVPAEQAL